MSTCGCWGATRCRCEPAPVHGHLYVSRRDAKTSVRIVAVGQGEVCFCLQLSQAQMEKGSWISLASDLFLVLAQGVAWSSNPLSISRVEVWWNLCFSWRVCFPFVESSWFSMRTMRLPRDGVRERCRRHEASLRRTWPSPGLGPPGGAPSAVVHHAQDPPPPPHGQGSRCSVLAYMRQHVCGLPKKMPRGVFVLPPVVSLPGSILMVGELCCRFGRKRLLGEGLSSLFFPRTTIFSFFIIDSCQLK